MLVVATGLFVAAALGDAVPTTAEHIDRAVLRYATASIFAGALVISLGVSITKNVLLAEPSLDELSRTGRLEDRLDDLRRQP